MQNLMIVDELIYHLSQTFGFAPTRGQACAMAVFARFMADPDPRCAMVLRGSAGTGKTSLAAAMVATMQRLRQRVVLLAPTGRAAKVLSLNAGGTPAYTIHRRIYRQKAFTGDMSGFSLNVNLHRDTLFFVDEASMISNGGCDQAAFGTGCLLDDMVTYIYGVDANCRMLLSGDTAQLPPVGQEESPALLTQVIEGYGLKVYECDLDEVVRQGEGSGILVNATAIRRMITHDDITQLPRMQLKGFEDISVVPGNELIESLAGSYSAAGQDETIVVTRSNKRAMVYNRGIRNMVLGREEELSQGDMVMVVKNNYYWTGHDKQSPMPFIANGDRAQVRRVRNTRELYGFRFADVTLTFPDYDDYELCVTVVLDSLLSEAPALSREQGDKLFNAVAADYSYLTRKPERMAKIKADPYFNALQVKHAYAVTCHKAQGGQWERVYLDQGYMTDDMLSPSYIHWLYTAFTRATRHLYLVNWPETQML